jgi:hypothetical protein
MKDTIRKILKEETLKQTLIDEIKDNGVEETAKMVGGIYNLIKVLDIKTATDYLHLFDDMDNVRSIEKDDWVLLRYKPKENIVFHNNSFGGATFVSYEDIWSVLKEVFAKDKTQIRFLIGRWLKSVYGIDPIKITYMSKNQLTLRTL